VRGRGVDRAIDEVGRHEWTRASWMRMTSLRGIDGVEAIRDRVLPAIAAGHLPDGGKTRGGPTPPATTERRLLLRQHDDDRPTRAGGRERRTLCCSIEPPPMSRSCFGFDGPRRRRLRPRQ
jgi:hypothetical protein